MEFLLSWKEIEAKPMTKDRFLKPAVQGGSEGGLEEPPGGLLSKEYCKKKAAHMCGGPGVVLNLACSGRSSETLSLGQKE